MRNFGLKLFLCALTCALLAPAAFGQGFEANRDEGLRAFKAGDYARAETLLAAALSDAAALPRTDARLIPVLEGLATAFLRQRKYAEAESPFQRALALRGRHSGHESLDVIPALHGLALLIQERALGADHLEVAATLDLYAALLRRLNRAEEAAALEARAAAIRAQ